MSHSNQNAVNIGIGDLHGHKPALLALLRSLQTHLGIFERGKHLRPGVQITFTGDYIDRGADSLGVLEILMAFTRVNPAQVHCLFGNHELLALADLDGAQSLIRHAQENPAAADELFHLYRYGIHGANGGEKFIQNFGTRALEAFEAYVAAMHRDAPIGRWLRALHPFYLHRFLGKRLLYVHGGVPKNLGCESSLEEYARKFQAAMAVRTLSVGAEAKYGLDNSLTGRESVFWNRSIPNGTPAEARQLADALQVEAIVIGHTPQRDGQIACYGDRVFNIDVAMCPAYGEHEPTAIVFTEAGPHTFRPSTGMIPLLHEAP